MVFQLRLLPGLSWGTAATGVLLYYRGLIWALADTIRAPSRVSLQFLFTLEGVLLLFHTPCGLLLCL